MTELASPEAPATEAAVGPSVLTAVGAYETHKGTDQPYDTIAVQELMTIERTHVPKDKARWVLCSTYNGPDGRSHKMQEAKGEFVMLAVDIDQGNILGRDVAKAVAGFVGKSQFLVYTSSSATQIERKWRVLIPLATPEKFDTWLAVMAALNNHLTDALGVEPDRALERAGQPIYLPNSAPRMDGAKPYEASDLKAGALFDWRSAESADAVLAVMQRQEDERLERERLQHEARQRMAQAVSSGGESSVIDQFNQANDLANVLAACGYKQKGDHWRSPMQSTDSYATSMFNEPTGQYWVSQSMSDLAAGVGSQARNGTSCFGDAFDLWCFFNFGNDRTEAIKAAAEQLGIKPVPSPADQLASMVRRQNTAKALTTLAGAPLAQARQPEPEQPKDAPAAPWTDFDVPAVEPKADGEQDEQPPLLSFVQASNLPNWEPPNELVEGILQEGVMTVIYGDSNTGKSFLALDMAAHISVGSPWFGREVKQGAVLYLAAESPKSIQNRARALAQKMDTKLDNLFITDCPVNVYDENGDTTAIINTIKAIQDGFGVRIRLVIVDTLARAMGSGDENSSKDMGMLVKHADMVRHQVDTHIMFIHHTGKDAARGARGSSALRAATDTEIEVSDPGNGAPKEFKITKQRDLEGKGEVYAFTLTKVNLGMSNFNKLLSTCYIEQAQPDPAAQEDKLTPIQKVILDAIRATPVGGLRYTEVASKLKEWRPSTADSTVSNNIKKLEKEGFLYFQSGQYRVGNGAALGRFGGGDDF